MNPQLQPQSHNVYARIARSSHKVKAFWLAAGLDQLEVTTMLGREIMRPGDVLVHPVDRPDEIWLIPSPKFHRDYEPC